MTQPRHDEWRYQWSTLEDPAETAEKLLRDWIRPARLEDLAGKTVLDAGCGPGHHTALAARHAKHVTGVDFNCAPLARERLGALDNVDVAEGDIARWDDGRRFDVVLSVGVVHHTHDPDETVAHLKTLVAPGGRLILWVYAREGNALNRWFVEPAKSVFVRFLPRPAVVLLAHVLTAAIHPVAHTVYRLPLTFLPYYEYFANWRVLGYRRDHLNVFDKLNAPVTHFISRARAESWVAGWKDPHVSAYVGVSWRVSATRPD